MTKVLNHFIGGRLVQGTSGCMADVFNPATGDISARVPLASADEVQTAIASSAAALPDWAATPPARPSGARAPSALGSHSHRSPTR